MNCTHQWKRVLSFMCPNEQQRRYECQTCRQQIECFEGPIKEIEDKIKENTHEQRNAKTDGSTDY